MGQGETGAGRRPARRNAGREMFRKSAKIPAGIRNPAGRP